MPIPTAFVVMQFAYLGHDAGHMAIAKSRFLNELIGQFSHSFILGGSFSYWKFKHNKHHAYPNHEYDDPDINNDPFSFTERKAKQRSGLKRIVTRYQSFLLPPVFLIMLFLMKLDSIKYMLKNRKGI
ncbi:fatty acid desaturase, partial [Candidatus Woesearchaeota archaeon]|nr:fatty acid desaturase [Candidatus Woesearchaeota archaeon]